MVKLGHVEQDPEEEEAQAPEEYDELHLPRALDDEADFLAVCYYLLVEVDAQDGKGRTVENGDHGLVNEEDAEGVHSCGHYADDDSQQQVQRVHHLVVDLLGVFDEVHKD